MPGPRILDGRYRLGELIGRGGMADVFRARDLRLDRTVAVKLMRADLARDMRFQARFQHEARAAAALNHPGIVAVFDTGEVRVTDGQHHPVDCPYVVLEHVSGRTLREVVEQGRVRWRRAAAWTVGMLEALEHAHGQGFVHRDVKPANVMVTDADAVKVMDFGIVQALAESFAITAQGQTVVGTALYLSPEQATGREVDARSDLYSTGCVLFELLTGRPPFTGDTPLAVAYQHVREEPPVPSSLEPSVPPALDAVLLRALRKDPGGRFACAAEFRLALEAALADPHAPDTAALAITVPWTDTDPSPATAGHAVAGSSLPGAPSEAQLAAAATVGGEPSPVTGSRPVVVASGAGATAVATAVVATGVPTGPVPLQPAPAPPSPDPEASSRRRTLGLALLGLLLLALFAGSALLRPGAAGGVPDLRGHTEAEAVRALADLGLQAVVVPVPGTGVPPGQVASTDPGEGATLAPGSEVSVHVSGGPGGVVIPDSLQGSAESAVREELERLGLPVSSVEYQDAGGLAHGELVRTDPSLGAAVTPGTPVVLHLSSGMVRVPDVRGMSVLDAQSTLRAAAPELTQRLSAQDGVTAEEGAVVMAQDPEPGSRVDRRAAITLATLGGEQPTAWATLPAEDGEQP